MSGEGHLAAAHARFLDDGPRLHPVAVIPWSEAEAIAGELTAKLSRQVGEGNLPWRAENLIWPDIVQLVMARAREFEADRGGAQISGDPQALASALDKIHRYAQGIPFPAAEQHPATAQMMIMNPLSGGGIANLFSTHPATEERIARLMEMARTGRFD